MKRTRRNHGATLKSPGGMGRQQRGRNGGPELAEQFSTHSTQITEWKR